jgi:hypothetical protein
MEGRDVVARFCAITMRHRTHDLVPTRANGQPAFGAYAVRCNTEPDNGTQSTIACTTSCLTNSR